MSMNACPDMSEHNAALVDAVENIIYRYSNSVLDMALRGHDYGYTMENASGEIIKLVEANVRWRLLSLDAVAAAALELHSMRPYEATDDARYVLMAALAAIGVTPEQETTNE